jgi:hypothetical protein
VGIEHFFHRSSVRGAVFELLREGQRVEFTPRNREKVRVRGTSVSSKADPSLRLIAAGRRPSRRLGSPHAHPHASAAHSGCGSLRLCKILLTACAAAVLLFLPFAGRFFSAADPLQRGDAIVVLAGSRVDRWLEAVDLFKEGWAPRVVLSPGPVSALEVKLRGEGLRLPREGDLARDAFSRWACPPTRSR